jgi:hypothetical protein
VAAILPVHMAIELTEPFTEMSNRYLSGEKSGRLEWARYPLDRRPDEPQSVLMVISTDWTLTPPWLKPRPLRHLACDLSQVCSCLQWQDVRTKVGASSSVGSDRSAGDPNRWRHIDMRKPAFTALLGEVVNHLYQLWPWSPWLEHWMVQVRNHSDWLISVQQNMYQRLKSVKHVVTCLLTTAFLHSVLRLLVTAKVVPRSSTVTLMMEATRSSETSVLTRATRRNTLEDSILHSDSRENLKSYKTIAFAISHFTTCNYSNTCLYLGSSSHTFVQAIRRGRKGTYIHAYIHYKETSLRNQISCYGRDQNEQIHHNSYMNVFVVILFSPQQDVPLFMDAQERASPSTSRQHLYSRSAFSNTLQ